jgi:anthranilate phosphoribosyltransferase
MVVHGFGRAGRDFPSADPLKFAELRDGQVKEYLFEPEQVGFKRCKLEDLHGGSAEQSAEIVSRRVGRQPRVRRAMWFCSTAARRSSSAVGPRTFKTGSDLPRSRLTPVKARQKLQQLAELTNAA